MVENNLIRIMRDWGSNRVNSKLQHRTMIYFLQQQTTKTQQPQSQNSTAAVDEAPDTTRWWTFLNILMLRGWLWWLECWVLWMKSDVEIAPIVFCCLSDLCWCMPSCIWYLPLVLVHALAKMRNHNLPKYLSLHKYTCTCLKCIILKEWCVEVESLSNSVFETISTRCMSVCSMQIIDTV